MKKLRFLKEAQGTLGLALPIVVTQMGQVAMGLIDSLMIGRAGTIPLAASAFANGLIIIFLVFGLGLSSGLAPLIAQVRGEGRDRSCGELLKHSLVLSLGFGILLGATVCLLSLWVQHFGQDAGVAEESKSFLILQGISIVPALVFQSFRQFSEGFQEPYFPVLITMIGLLLNVLCNWLWIYGNWGFPAMGLTGSGWATLTARASMVLMIVVRVYGASRFQAVRSVSSWTRFQRSDFRSILYLGIPTAFQFLFEVGAFASAAIMMGWISASTLAAHQIAISAASLTFMIAMGLSIASSVRCGYAMGRNQWRRVRRIGFGAVSMGALSMGVCGGFFIVFRESIPRFYVDDVDVIHQSAQLLIWAALFQVFDGAQGVCSGVLRGLHDVRVPTLITFIGYWMLSLPLAYVLGFKTSMKGQGIWCALTIGLGFAALCLNMRFHRLTMRRLQ